MAEIWRHWRIGVVVVLLAQLLAAGASASGSYVARAAHRAGINDYAKYELGKSISAGEVELGARSSGAAGVQLELLSELQSELPRSARSRLDLPALAGRLSGEQLDAVQYYLQIRYRIRR
ncbi:MAG: hypothetical protein ACYTAF_17275 [Planctomycetota bacterium]|jgi:hypothetical protein